MNHTSTIGYDSVFGKRLLPLPEEVDSYVFDNDLKSSHYIFTVLKIMKRF